MRGFLYVMTNPSMPQIVKIGFSTKDPTFRADELSGTSVPTPFTVHYDVLVEDPFSLEQAIHSRLRGSGSGAGKEFFSLNADSAVAEIRAFMVERNIPALHESKPTYRCEHCNTWSIVATCRCHGATAAEDHFQQALFFMRHRNYERAQQLLTQASVMGHSEAKDALFSCAVSRIDEGNFPEGVNLFRTLVAVGKLGAAFELALVHKCHELELQYGDHAQLPDDVAQANALAQAEIASDQGYKPAACWLALHYHARWSEGGPQVEEVRRKGQLNLSRLEPAAEFPSDLREGTAPFLQELKSGRTESLINLLL